MLRALRRDVLLGGVKVRCHPGFVFDRCARFERFGQATDTAIYCHGDAEFVFVPGATVTLGWERFAHGMDEASHGDLQQDLGGIGVDDMATYLRERMSPVRQVTIAPMLVERVAREIGWRAVPMDSPELAPYASDIEAFHRDGLRELIVNDAVRIRNLGGAGRRDRLVFNLAVAPAPAPSALPATGPAAQAWVYGPISLDELHHAVQAEGFRLPTEDEWEYLCGGGSRTLFPWGDGLDSDLRLKHIDEAGDAGFSLAQANPFGLVIADDPYRQEVVQDGVHFLKGGDGGCNLCGGGSALFGYLPTATFYRMPPDMLAELDYRDDIGGEYTCHRRVLTVDDASPPPLHGP